MNACFWFMIFSLLPFSLWSHHMEHRRHHMSCTLLEYMLTRLCPRYALHMAFSIYLSNGNADLDCHCTVVQGAHPFTPYAMTSPNGNADATVRHDKLNFIFLVLIIQESNASSFLGNYCSRWWYWREALWRQRQKSNKKIQRKFR